MDISEEQKQIFKGKICPYCKKPSILTDSSVIYGKSYGMIYLCKPCDAYAGVHKGTVEALGRLANAELRKLKKQAHAAFDPIWQTNLMTRSEAYKCLSRGLGTPIEYTHIGMFGEDTCRKVIELSQILINNQPLEYGK